MGTYANIDCHFEARNELNDLTIDALIFQFVSGGDCTNADCEMVTFWV